MPSPIAHLGAGCALYLITRRVRPDIAAVRLGPVPVALAVAVGYSVAPDIDSVVGLLSGNFGRYHNNLTHSLLVGLMLSLLPLLLMRRHRGAGPLALLALSAYSLHIVMDAASITRGVMAFWPLSSERVLVPVPLFYGVHWSNGLISHRHIITLVTELLFVLVVMLLVRSIPRQIGRQE